MGKERMMKRSKVILVALITLVAAAVAVAPALARRSGNRAAHPRGGLMPELTAEQKEQIEEIHEKYSDERAELTNRAEVLALELGDLVGDGEPDFNGIEDKLEEISRVRLDLMKLRLRIHREIRPLLDEDQKMLFDRGLARLVERRAAGGRRGMMGRGGRWGQRAMGGRQSMMGHGPMGGHFGTGRGSGPGMMQGGPPEDVEDDD
jgi:Spy/CpxP family protein refolding chaperone